MSPTSAPGVNFYRNQATLFDAIGNLVRKDGVGSLIYPAAGMARPHALSRIEADQAVAGLLNTSLTYDANGNLLDGLNRHYTWTTYDRLAAVDSMDGATAVQRTAFLFGPDRQRVRQTISPMTGGVLGSATTTVYYAGAVEKEVDTTTGTTTLRTYLPSSLGYIEETVSSVVAQPGDIGAKSVRYFLTDHLGSVLGVVDESGAVLQRMSYDPWGRRRTEAGSARKADKSDEVNSASTPPGGPDDDGDPKPTRVTNQKHHPNSKSPEPKNVDQLHENSIADQNGVRWAKDADGTIPRFSKASNGGTHWNGSTSGVDPIQLQTIPVEIRRIFGVKPWLSETRPSSLLNRASRSHTSA